MIPGYTAASTKTKTEYDTRRHSRPSTKTREVSYVNPPQQEPRNIPHLFPSLKALDMVSRADFRGDGFPVSFSVQLHRLREPPVLARLPAPGRLGRLSARNGGGLAVWVLLFLVRRFVGCVLFLLRRYPEQLAPEKGTDKQ